MTRTFRRMALVGLVTLVGVAGIGRANSSASAAVATAGGEVFEGWLDDEETASYDLWLPQNALVRVVGRCDRDCSDLDLSLHNRFGRLVAEDDLVDSIPVLSYRVQSSGTHRLDVRMYACHREPCHYRVAVTY